ncbi:MAG: homoserine O-acetyltransferase [Pirellulaceae bacterium]
MFDSSDSDRHARQLRYAQRVTFEESFTLERGGQLAQVTVAYETYGQLSPQRDNAVVICHALSGDSHVASHDEEDDSGWWDVMVGSGKAIDTDRYFVICPNILGGCRGTTGPNSYNPATGRPYGPDFPLITVSDMVDVQRRLIDHLGISRLLAVVGGSLGGHMALQWATSLPDRLEGVLVVASSARLTSQALAFDVVGRNAILCDPHYQSGQYYGARAGPQDGLAIARMLGHITYLSRVAMMDKFDADRHSPPEVRSEFETRFSVGSYLAHQGDKFVERFDANSYLTLTMAMDLFDLGSTPRELSAKLRKSSCKWLLVSYSSDWLFPPFQSREIVDALIREQKPVTYCNVESNCGHDAFLLPDDMDRYGELVRFFLFNLLNNEPKSIDWCATRNGAGRECDTESHHPTSIFHQQHRLDYDSILELIPTGASVLDLGCGNGGLLAALRSRGHERIAGIELDERAIVRCAYRGIDVVQADLNEGLAAFPDKQFDFVVLSQTLQTVTDVRRVLNEMVRVGERGVVSFPNFGYHKYRHQLMQQGKAPQVDPGEGYHWYDTPNIRFLSIADFESFCDNHGYQIHQRIALDTDARCHIEEDPNLNADMAIMVLSR